MSVYLFDQIHLFDNLTPAQTAIVKPLFAPIEEYTGAIIFEQGELAEYLYIVVEGEVLIQYKPDDGPLLVIARIRPEGVVGWSAALGSPYYTSTAVCAAPCKLLRVSGADLHDLYQSNPETGSLVLDHLAEVIAKRLRNTHAHVLALLENGLRYGIRKPVELDHFSS